MDTQTMQTCCSFGDVALKYYPCVERGTAIRRLRDIIKNNTALESELEKTGFFNNQNIVTPLQYKIIVFYLEGN